MNSIQEVAKALTEEMLGIPREYDPSAAKQLSRLAVIDYATALRRSVERSVEENERFFTQAYVMFARAVSAGAKEEELDESFRAIRNFWIPRLGKGVNRAEDRAV